jgi:hypothetical protein
MKKLIVSMIIIPLCITGFGQDLCGSLDHQKLSQPFIANMAAVSDYVYGTTGQHDESKEWPVYPVIRLNIVKAGEGNYSFNLAPEHDAIIMVKKDNLVWCDLQKDSPTVMTGISMLVNREIRDKGDFRKGVFFLRPLSYVQYDFDLLVYCDKGKLVIEDDQANKYGSVPDFLKAKYGSLEKYDELYEENTVKEWIRKGMPVVNMGQAMQVISSYGSFRSKYFPNDTLGNINYLMKDIQVATSITPDQSRLIRSKILFDLEQLKKLGITGEQLEKASPVPENTGYALMHIDIDPIVKSVLTQAQSTKWERWLEVKHRQLVLAENMIFDNLQIAGNSTKDKHTLYEEKLKSLFVN